MSSLFFDTSAVVPLIIQEPFSDSAREVWSRAGHWYAWRWLKVENEAALLRRNAPPAAWRNWGRVQTAFNWIELPDGLIDECCRFNQNIRLRAADAGHLFVMDRLTRAIDDLKLVTFDREMNQAAEALGLGKID